MYGIIIVAMSSLSCLVCFKLCDMVYYPVGNSLQEMGTLWL